MKRILQSILLIFMTFPAIAEEGFDLSGPAKSPAPLIQSAQHPESELRPGFLSLTEREIDSLLFPGPEAVLISTRDWPSARPTAGVPSVDWARSRRARAEGSEQCRLKRPGFPRARSCVHGSTGHAGS